MVFADASSTATRFVARLVHFITYTLIFLSPTVLILASFPPFFFTLPALYMGNWQMDVRLFEYFGELGKLQKRLLASRALSGWKDINVRPRNPEFSKDHIFTEDVIGAMVLHAYGEHLHEMGKLHLIVPKVNSTLT